MDYLEQLFLGADDVSFIVQKQMFVFFIGSQGPFISSFLSAAVVNTHTTCVAGKGPSRRFRDFVSLR